MLSRWGPMGDPTCSQGLCGLLVQSRDLEVVADAAERDEKSMSGPPRRVGALPLYRTTSAIPTQNPTTARSTLRRTRKRNWKLPPQPDTTMSTHPFMGNPCISKAAGVHTDSARSHIELSSHIPSTIAPPTLPRKGPRRQSICLVPRKVALL